MKMVNCLLTIIAVTFLAFLEPGFSTDTINYQGKLMDTGGIPVDETKDVAFTIYQEDDLVGWTSVWTESHNDVSISNGFFSVALNSVNQDWLVIDFSRNLELEIAVADSDGNNEEILSPRLALTKVNEAIRVESIDNARGGTIGYALTVADDGKVGIGTLVPEAKLHIVSTNESDSEIRLESAAADDSVIMFKETDTNRNNGKILFDNHGGALAFYVDGEGATHERMRIDVDGDVGIGTTNPGYPLHIAGGAYCNGSTWVNASSRDLKKDVRDLSLSEYEEVLAELENTELVRYRYKNEEKEDKLRIGVIAEDAPRDIVSADGKGIDTADAIGFLLAVVKAQQKEIEELKKAIEGR